MCGPLSGHGQTALLPRRGIGRWPSAAPLFVGADGERITRGALVHGLRHTFATELANADVSVYTLMRLLGHESMATSQRYVAGAVPKHAPPQHKTLHTGSRADTQTSPPSPPTLLVCFTDNFRYTLNPLQRNISRY
jgi:hypothetical protein